MKASVIIPAYNEEKAIEECLYSLVKQNYNDFEIIVVDDGSKDKTVEIVRKFKEARLIQQDHLGPAIARNLGVKNSRGEILVFVDADMIFDKNFLKELIEPISKTKIIGTFSKQELVLNKDNIWSKCWNINKNISTNRMHPKNYPDTQSVFRAILKSEFLKTSGFKPIGYVDDYTLSEQLGIQAVAVKGAIFYHRNPETLKEVYNQARWIGKSEYKRRKIKNETLMKFIMIFRYNFLFSLINGIRKAVKYNLVEFLIFKIIFDFAITISLLKSFFKEQLYK